MPTSSQALILYNDTGKKPAEVLHMTRSSLSRNICSGKDPAPYTIAAVYNLSGCVPLSKNAINDHDAVQALGRDSAQLFKYHRLPDGYTSILAFDTETHNFRWQALGGTADDTNVGHLVASESLQDTTDTEEAEIIPRPASAAISRTESRPCYVDYETYDKLIGLGFRRSTLAVDPNSVRKVIKPPVVAKKIYRATRQTENKDVAVADSRGDVTESSCDDETSDTSEFEDEFTRIKPSLYMRKDVPADRPTSVIFSFRDNEFSSHAEVKYLIETQIGVKVKTVQFDPLDVRVCKPEIRSRWIVDLFTTDDLNTACRKGMILGKDKIIIFKHDDIAKREVSSFKYFMRIQEAKKKLKGSKSLKTPNKERHRAAIRLKATKSGPSGQKSHA